MNDRKPRTGLVLGFILAGAALLGLGFCTRTLQRDQGPPEIEVLAPAPGSSITDSLVIVFRTDAPLRLTAHGWAADDLHPHVLLDGTEHMAAASDITDAGDVFRWRLPLPAAGEHTLLLSWAARHHGAVGDTTGRSIRFEVR